jgi:hypothetical protein
MKIRSGALALVVVIGMLLVDSVAQAQVLTPKGPVLVYESNRTALEVSITRRGNRVWRARVGAPGVCDNGEEWSSGFGLVGGIGWPIYPNETFHRTGGNQLFSGRFEGDKVVGVFFETGFEVGGSTEVFPPTCGNTRPRGRHQHFVARLVERNHKPVRGSGP